MKKMMILMAGAVVLSSAAKAQISLAPEIGLNLANMHGKENYNNVEYNHNGGIKLGVKAGLNVDVPLGTRLMLQPGIFYSIKGYKDHDEQTNVPGVSYKNNYTLHYAEIPLNLQYLFNDPGEGRFFIGVGGYAGIAFSGKNKYTRNIGNVANEGTADLKFGNDAPSNDLRRFDFGGQVNAGYQLRSGIFFRGMYQAGISNMLPQGNRTTGDASLRSTNITISLGYTLGSAPAGKKRGGGEM